jgi:hypothetical protein
MRLFEFIRADAERIVREWEEFAKTLSAGAGLPRWMLRVHAPAILQSIAQKIETSQLPVEQQANGKLPPGLIEHITAAHLRILFLALRTEAISRR